MQIKLVVVVVVVVVRLPQGFKGTREHGLKIIGNKVTKGK